MDKVFVKSRNGNKLACLVAKPKKVGGLVVSSQGFGSTKEKPQYQSLLKELPKLGFIVVVFEFQGLGESEGKLGEKTATRDLEDLRAVVEYAFNNFDFDKEKFFIFGSSFGGLTALNFALEDKRVKGLVLKCPVSDLGYINDRLSKDRKRILDYEAFLKDGRKYDIYSKVSKLKIPVKIIHGDKDTMVPIEQSKKLASLLPNAELFVLKGAEHNFDDRKEEVYEKVIELLEGLK